MTCKHEKFEAHVDVARLEDVGRFVAEVKIRCSQCNVNFEFQGLEPGVSTSGSFVSMDGKEARLAILPPGVQPNPMQRLMGVRSH